MDFDIDQAMARVAEAVVGLPKAALFELYEQGHSSPFEQLVACVISIRTLDEVMLPCARSLFALARTPLEMSRLPPGRIDAAIAKSTFHERKALQIQAMARRIVDEHDGALPCDKEIMLSFQGVGPKCANLALGIACGRPHIGVDVHVHRICNRWGYVAGRTPERTLAGLEQKLPRRYWIDINRLLVPFGKHVCTGKLPNCKACPVAELCQQVGVSRHR